MWMSCRVKPTLNMCKVHILLVYMVTDWSTWDGKVF